MSRTVPTSVDVARAAGVAQVTVSRALSGKASVASATRKRVLEAARQLGYQPNSLAAGLRGSSTRSFGLIWPIYTTFGDAKISMWLLRTLRRKGYAVYQADYEEQTLSTMNEMLRRRVDGLVYHWNPDRAESDLIENICRFPMAVVVGYRAWPDLPVDQIVHDRRPGIIAVADHFAATGRKQPVFMVPDVECNDYKRRVFLDRCRQNGLPSGPEQILSVPSRPGGTPVGEPYEEALAGYLKDHPLPDALFCCSDRGAMAAIKLLLSRGLSVPDDVAVIGFNDTEYASLWNPPLASIDRRSGDLAGAIERMMLSRLEEPGLPPRCETIPMKLILRKSAGYGCPTINPARDRADSI